MRSTLALTMLAVLTTGCMSNSTKISYDRCSYSEAPEYSAPGWICGEPVDGLRKQAFGYSKKLGSGPGMMRDVAAAEARNSLAAEFRSEVSSRLESLSRSEMETFSTEGTDQEQEISTTINERVQRNLTTMDITGSKIHFIQNAPGGGMYVLVGLDNEAYEDNIDRLMEATFEEDGPETFRDFLLDEANTAINDTKENL